jgi:hypothetical protein
MTREVKLGVPEHVMSRRLGDDCVMLDLASGTYFGLDPVGARFWELVNEGRSVSDACEALSREYDASPERIEADVAALVQELAAHGLVIPA